MISLVLKKGTDYGKLHKLLNEQGYIFKVYGSGRVIGVDTPLETFTLKEHADLEHCYEDKQTGYEPQYSARTLPDTHHQPDSTPNADSWAMSRICRRSNPYYDIVNGYAPDPVSTEYAWGRTGDGVDCYLIDAGIYPSHPAFTGRVTWVSDGSTTREDTLSDHGNWVASNMAGVGCGLATDALIWFVQSPPGSVTELMMVAQYDEVYQHYLSRAGTNRPAVLNHSFNGAAATLLPAAVAIMGDLIEAGIVVCVAAGNYHLNTDDSEIFPSEYDPDVVNVGSHGPDDSIMEYTRQSDSRRVGSGTGAAVDLYGPGVGIMGAYQQSGYSQINGTSFASPYTAGVIALMLQGYQRLTHREQVRSVARRLIQNTTKDKLRYNPNGKGVVNNRILYIDPTLTFEEIPGLETI